MVDFFKFIGYILSSFYNILDVKLFPDMPITCSQLIVSLFVLVAILKFSFFFSRVFGITTSLNDFRFKGKPRDNSTLEDDILKNMDAKIDYRKCD